MPDHVKEKILLFFLKTSVPRILEKEGKIVTSNSNISNSNN